MKNKTTRRSRATLETDPEKYILRQLDKELDEMVLRDLTDERGYRR